MSEFIDSFDTLSKKCNKCQKIKSIDEFAFRSDRPDKKLTYCRSCKRIWDKISYHKKKKERFFDYKASRVLSRAASLKVPSNLTAEYLRNLWTGICPILNVSLDYTSPRSEEHAPELDRIVPNHGYVMGNVVWMSRKANRIKNNVTLDELKNLVQWLESVLKENEIER